MKMLVRYVKEGLQKGIIEIRICISQETTLLFSFVEFAIRSTEADRGST